VKKSRRKKMDLFFKFVGERFSCPGRGNLAPTVFCLYFFILLLFPTLAFAQSFPRFFLQGDGHLKIKNVHNGRFAEVTYLKNHLPEEKAFQKIDHVFGFSFQEHGEHISYRLIAMLDYFSDQVDPNGVVEMNSGYRSPQYNENLRKQGRTAAKTSTHRDGMALDFSMKGMDAKKMWETIREKDCCGVGYYHGSTVHLDSGRPRFWTTVTSKVKTGASDYNRFLSISTEYDRYLPGEKTRIFLTSISDFGFGISPKIKIVKEGTVEKYRATMGDIFQMILSDPSGPVKDCYSVDERKKARFLYVTFPKKLKPGRYRLKMEFCKKVHDEMPDTKFSNVFEIK